MKSLKLFLETKRWCCLHIQYSMFYFFKCVVEVQSLFSDTHNSLLVQGYRGNVCIWYTEQSDMISACWTTQGAQRLKPVWEKKDNVLNSALESGTSCVSESCWWSPELLKCAESSKNKKKNGLDQWIGACSKICCCSSGWIITDKCVPAPFPSSSVRKQGGVWSVWNQIPLHHMWSH